MIFSSGVRVLTPAYYAVKNTWFPALVACICLFVHLIVAPLLMAQFQVHGLMISTIISATLNLSLLLIFFKKLVGDFEYLKFFKNLSIFSGLAILTGCVANIYFFIEIYLPKGSFYLLLNIFLSIMLSLMVFAGLGYLFKITTVTEALNKVLRKIKKAQ
jgi:putative peptidoglycan lipid II flippase